MHTRGSLRDPLGLGLSFLLAKAGAYPVVLPFLALPTSTKNGEVAGEGSKTPLKTEFRSWDSAMQLWVALNF